MRVAVISSPRSGNSWLRLLLSETLALEELSVHNWREVEGGLPESCILQIHWYREPGFQAFLRDNGFKIVTITRHPLDILLSVLRFCKYDPNNARWLEGNCDLGGLFNNDLTPRDRVFLDWCAGFGCENLLSVTYQWFHEPGVIKVRYEDLVRDPRHTINAVASWLTGKSNSVTDETLVKYGMPYWKALPNKHGWQGRPGLWRELYTRRSCRAIYERHERVFDTLAYNVEEARWGNSRRKILKKWKQLNADDPRMEKNIPAKAPGLKVLGAFRARVRGGQKSSP